MASIDIAADQRADFAGASRGLVARIGSAALALTGLFARELRLRRDMRRLADMDDRMLEDMGITRGDIADAVRTGRSGFLD